MNPIWFTLVPWLTNYAVQRCSALCIEALFIWFLAAAALALFIYVPYAEYVTGFLNEAGATKHL